MNKNVEVIAPTKCLNKSSNNKLIRACAYCRVSTDSEDQKTSYDSQRIHYKNYIEENPNYEFVGIYADEGITGTQTKKREQFNQMMSDALNGKIDLIIAKSISRFARNTVDTLNCVRTLREHDVDVYFEKENIHTLGLSNELGIPSPTGRKWCHASVRRVITNEKYVGDLRSGKYYSDNVISHKRKVNYGEKEQYFTSNHHEAIISRELWNKCQEILEKRSKIVKLDGNRDKFSRKYPFSSKIYCGICGERFIRRSYKIRSNNKEVAYWICRSYRNKIECSNLLHYKQEELEDIFIKVYNKLTLNKDTYINSFIKKVNDTLLDNTDYKNSNKIKEEISRLQNRLSNLIDLKLDNKIPKEILESKELEITAQINELENKLISNQDLELTRKQKLEQVGNIVKILKEYPGLTKFNEDIFNNLVDRIIIGEVLDNGEEDLYRIKFILKTGEMMKDNLPNNTLKIGTDLGHYGFRINKQVLEIKEDNVSAYVLRKNSNI